MEYSLYKKDGAFPCDVTIDVDNNIYTVRDSDTTGQIFQSAPEVASWIKQNWAPDQFEKPDDYYDLVNTLESSLQEDEMGI
ncbi:hypothetical protein SAMN04488137_0733 [Fictibacillus solisalsi]|uniref:Threonine dehydratase n=1 Tax=Fictibacillus solisalsi TaxID=459525 RepID=A0A1G9U6U7_9BACL|nr:hypothetical protein [Fictibacillus solisalsi]SDM55572.1 hypothetical protein SAMN04488137_0733 [Fictibacillus solisalsi]